MAAVSAMPRAPEWHPAPRPAPVGRLVKRDVQQPFPKQMPNIEENAKEEGVAVAGENDMDKAETFGFGERMIFIIIYNKSINQQNQICF